MLSIPEYTRLNATLIGCCEIKPEYSVKVAENKPFIKNSDSIR